MVRILLFLTALSVFPSFAGAVGLARGDSYAGLRCIQGPLRITWTIDATTIKQVGGGAGFADDFGAVAFKRLKADGIPMQDGSFDPLQIPFVSLDLWARGVTKAEDPGDPQRVFNFQIQVFVPAHSLRGQSKQKGRVSVWERSIYGVCAADDIKNQVRTFLRLCGDFAVDYRNAHGMPSLKAGKQDSAPAAPRPAASQGTTRKSAGSGVSN